MAGIKHLKDIYNKEGISFVNELLNKYLVCFEKMDGCLSEDTIVTTENGEKTIKSVCEERIDKLILSIDLHSDEKVFDLIVDYNIQENNNDWYLITLTNGVELKLTGNHKIWLPKLYCWRRVDELEGNEYILYEK